MNFPAFILYIAVYLKYFEGPRIILLIGKRNEIWRTEEIK